MVAAHEAEQNLLLRALPIEDYATILPQLELVRLGIKQTLIEPDAPIQDVYFIREGVASIVAEEQEASVEVGTIGPEGFVGMPILFGADSMPYHTFIQVEGEALRLGAAAFARLVEERPALRRLLLRFAQYWTSQLSQSVACNRIHTLNERCARWLLMTHDRVEGDAFELTHEFLALMLGVRRAGVTVAMGALQAEGIVTYSRGRIHILDRQRLEEASCACYGITQSHYEKVVGPGGAG